MVIPIKSFKKGAFIYLSGNVPLKEFYIVKSGQIKISRTNTVLGMSEEVKSAGYIVGIVQCITGIPAEENVVALTDCEIFIIHKEKVEEVFKTHKKIILKILSEYSEILRKLDSDLINFHFFSDNKNRIEKMTDAVDKFIKIDEKNKASHLLLSIIDENKNNKNLVTKSIKMLTFLPKLELFKQDKIISDITLEKNSVIFTEFEKGDNFFIIKKGKVKITKLKKDREILLAILGEGEIFGEMSIFNDKPRNATAVTDEETELMAIDKKGINNLPPPLFIKVLDFLSRRIWLIQRQIICYKLPVITAKLYYLLASKMIVELKIPDRVNKDSYIFKFPVKELYEMIDYEYDETKKDEVIEFLNDKNLEFYKDCIKIKDLGAFLDKSSYLFSRSLIVYNSRMDRL